MRTILLLSVGLAEQKVGSVKRPVSNETIIVFG